MNENFFNLSQNNKLNKSINSRKRIKIIIYRHNFIWYELKLNTIYCLDLGFKSFSLPVQNFSIFSKII
jgi:hypothetical protein